MNVSCKNLRVSAVLLATLAAGSASAEPKVDIMTQWVAGSEGAAIVALGKLYEKNGGTWKHTGVAGHTTTMMSKLRADILSGNPPAASQLKGPEIAAWSKIRKPANLDTLAAAENWDKVVPAALIKLHKPAGSWIAVPLHIYRLNAFYSSTRALAKIGETKAPKTWAEFNAMAEKMAASGITPVAHSGLPHFDAQLYEVILAGINPEAHRKGIMELDAATLRGPDSIAAFDQLRKMTKWMDKGVQGRHWRETIGGLTKGEFGFLQMGNWASGVMKINNYKEGEDFICGPAPSASGKPPFIINTDSVIFFEKTDKDVVEGQTLLAKTIMSNEGQIEFSTINGSIPARSDIPLNSGYGACQNDAHANLDSSTADKTLLLSLAHNMAQPNAIAGAMIEAISSFATDPKMSSKDGADRLIEAIANAK